MGLCQSDTRDVVPSVNLRYLAPSYMFFRNQAKLDNAELKILRLEWSKKGVIT